MDPEMQRFAAYAFLAVMLMAAFWICHGGRRADAKRHRRFDHRPEIAVDEFLGTLGSPELIDRSLAASLLHEVSNAIGVPPGKLRAEDRFDTVLAPIAGWEPDDGIYLVMAEWLRRARQSPKHNLLINTLGDLVQNTCTRPTATPESDTRQVG